MPGGRIKKSILNLSFNYINQILILILSFISRTVFIHYLSIEYLGINGLFSDILELLSMADLGFNTAMSYSFYKPLAEKDYKKIAGLTTFYKKVYNIIAIVVTVLGLSVVPFLRKIINLDKNIPNLEVYYLFSLAGIVVTYLFVYRTSIVTADQNNYILTRISMIVSVIKVVAQILVLMLFRSYIVYLCINIISAIVCNVIAANKAVKLYPQIKEKESLSKSEQKDILYNMKSIFIYKVSSVLLNATDNLLISTIIGTIAVGYYSNYLMIVNRITMFYGLIFSSLTASIGNLIVKEEKRKRYEVFQCEQAVSFFISGIIIPCYMVLVNDFINVWLGDKFLFEFSVVLAIGFNMYLACIFQPLWSYREATGLYQKTKWVMALCALINIVLSVILGSTIGLVGIIMASCISRILTYAWYEPIILFKTYFGVSPKKYFISNIKNIMIVLVITIAINKISGVFLIDSWIKLILKGVVIFCICIIMMFLIYRKSEGIQILVKRVSKIKESVWLK